MSDFGRGRLPENQPLVGEGYTVLDLPNFGLSEAAAAAAGFDFFAVFGDDVRGITIGPDSECDAVVIESRSFPSGRMVVSTRCPWFGYVKGPFKITPFYVNNFGVLVSDEPSLNFGAYKAQVVLWTHLPYLAPPTVRPPKRYAFTNYQRLDSWWNNGYQFFVPAFGRKAVRFQLGASQAVTFPTLALDFISMHFGEDAEQLDTSEILYTQPQASGIRSYWPTIEIETGALFSGVNFETTLRVQEILRSVATAANVGAVDRQLIPAIQRPDWFGVTLGTLSGADPGTADAQIDLYVTVYDE